MPNHNDANQDPRSRYSWAQDIEHTNEQKAKAARHESTCKAIMAASVMGCSALGAIIAEPYLVKMMFVFIGLAVTVKMAAVDDGINIDI